MDPTLKSEDQISVFAALNKVSDDGKTGYYYYLLLWVDPDAGEKRPWTASASKEDLHVFAREQTAGYPPALRALVEKVPVEGYSNTGFQLQGGIAMEDLLREISTSLQVSAGLRF